VSKHVFGFETLRNADIENVVHNNRLQHGIQGNFCYPYDQL